MNESRLRRYKGKITVIEKRQGNIFSWISDEDEKTVLAVYKAFQEMIESFTDICAMLLKDMGEIVEDDYSNIGRLSELEVFDNDQELTLKEADGLRNRLIHEYNGLERKTALRSIQQINELVEDIIKDVRIWIKKISKQ
ncbi:MAG: DUF86 domain-containing protein [Candidatus Thermoplasmatota archaeon]